MSNIILQIKNLSFSYGAKKVLNDLSLDIAQGELVGIIGPNGSGKTTLLKIISRVIQIKSGQVFFEQKDIQKLDNRIYAQNLAVVSQNLEQSMLNVFDFVLMARTPYFSGFQLFEKERDIKIAQDYMRLCDIWHLRNKRLDQLSGGERQLASIARALVQEPRLLLMDEPTSHLDISHQVQILDLIKSLNQKLAITVIIVLHDLNLVSTYGNRIILLKEGALFKSGAPQEVLRYDIIEEVYNTVVVVKENPLNLRPYIFVVPGEYRQKK
jgi:iron complex transport system ATP-binding protein